MSSEARIYLVHYRVSFPQPGRLFFSVTGVRKRDGYTSNFLDKIRAQIVFYLTFARSENTLPASSTSFYASGWTEPVQGLPNIGVQKYAPGSPRSLARFNVTQCLTLPHPPMRTGTIFTSSREAGSAPDCFNELAACLRKVTSDFPSTRTIPCALSIPVSGSTPGFQWLPSALRHPAFYYGFTRLISGNITYAFDRD